MNFQYGLLLFVLLWEMLEYVLVRDFNCFPKRHTFPLPPQLLTPKGCAECQEVEAGVAGEEEAKYPWLIVVGNEASHINVPCPPNVMW